jgi:hypothetical protein
VSQDAPDIAEAIVKFVESLPSTISSNILVFVMVYALDLDTMEVDTFLPTIRDQLTKTGGMKRMSVTLRMVAALDFLLCKRGRFSSQGLPNLDKLRPELRARIEASQPLMRKHFEKALADWRKLRATRITHETLSDYEDILLRRSAFGR